MCCRRFKAAADVKSIYSDRYDRLRAALIAARKAAGLTQAEVAAALSRPQSFVAKYEGGERRLDVIEFLDVCRATGASAVKIVRAL